MVKEHIKDSVLKCIKFDTNTEQNFLVKVFITNHVSKLIHFQDEMAYLIFL